MEDTFMVLFAIGLMTLSVVGINCMAADHRHFDRDIIKPCSERGYIQDNNTRIICSVEKKDK